MAHVQILAGTQIGADCEIHPGAVIGDYPQYIAFKDKSTPVTIGDGVVIREYVTIHGGAKPAGTRIGRQTYLMAYVHVGHDCLLGDEVVLANAVQVGGFVEIGDFASIGGLTPIHQFCRVGAHAFIGGGFRVVQDVPPYIIASGEPLQFSGLNQVGLRRRKFPAEVRDQLKQAYKLIYRSEYNIQQALEQIRRQLDSSVEIETILAFIEQSDRGII